MQSVVERYIQLNAVKWVDEIIPYETETDLCNLFNLRHFDVRIIGEEYFGKPFTGKDINLKNGTEIIYNKRRHDFSSTLKRMQISGNWLAIVLNESQKEYGIVALQDILKVVFNSKSN